MKRIARERLKRSLTQSQVAQATGVSYSTYFQTEQGRNVPGKSSPTARKLERFFGYRLKTLLAEAS